MVNLGFGEFGQGGAILNTEQYVPDALFAGVHAPITPDTVVIASGEGQAKRGWVLGEITKALGAVTPGTNTGDGTVTGAALGKAAKVGTYHLVCTAAAANGGTFHLMDPDGIDLGAAEVGQAYSGPLAFTINDGATDFIVGDAFAIAVEATNGKYRLVNSTHADGSQVAVCILGLDADATSADAPSSAYMTGEYNVTAVTFGGSDTPDMHYDELAARGIFLKTNIPGYQTQP